jgi:uncharacterized damage-inducible protein DinB
MTAYQLLKAQYQSIKSARHVLFDYCKSMAKDDLLKDIDTFNETSIGRLLMHIANCYIHWLIMFAQETDVDHKRNEQVTSFTEIEDAFQHVDKIVEEFLTTHQDGFELTLTKKRPNLDLYLTVTPLQLFTHVTTHEFHHKGQILTMSRILGYIPVDTDTIRC